LSHPGRAIADARSIEGGFIPWNGVAVEHNSRDIQDAGSHVTAQSGAIRTDDSFAIDVAQVRVSPVERDAQPASLQLSGEGDAILDDLFL